MSAFKSPNSYREFASRTRREARFIRTPEDDDFLREVVRTSRSRIREVPTGKIFYRAQLGHDWRREDEDSGHVVEVPYCPSRMRPRQGCAKEGRTNPKGISVLYLATHEETAMSEVRPWIGSFVSCAIFKTKRPLRIVDFSVYHNVSHETIYDTEQDPSEREKAVWMNIDQAFSEPTTLTDEAADYVPTQILAELFKAEGYDGIAYKSAFGDNGYNTVLFDPNDAELTFCRLHQAKSIKVEFEECANPYWSAQTRIGKTARR